MGRYRRSTALIIVAVLAGACTALPGASDAVPSDPPSPSLPGASQDPTTAPVASPEVSPSRVSPVDGDVAPPEVMGATFLAELTDGVTVVGRVGLKERLVVPAGSFAFFDRAGTVIISTPGATDTELSRIDIATGEVLWRTSVTDVRHVGSITGATLVLGGRAPDALADPGLILVDVATGTSRVLTPARPAPRDAISWSRAGLITPSGTQVLTSLCALEGCENSLVDVADGSTVRSLPGTTPPWIAVEGYTVTHDGTTTMGIDLATGKAVWTRTGGSIEGYPIDGTQLVSLWVVEGDERTYSLEIVDVATGRSRVISQWPATERWSLWSELSTATRAVIGRDGPLRGAWLDGQAPEAKVVDLATGTFEDAAVRLAGIQP